jgi:hypothetical protein
MDNIFSLFSCQEIPKTCLPFKKMRNFEVLKFFQLFGTPIVIKRNCPLPSDQRRTTPPAGKRPCRQTGFGDVCSVMDSNPMVGTPG